MTDEHSAEIGEVKESDEVATFILRRADVVMEAWQVANALTRMSAMIPKDKKRRKKLRQAAEHVVSNFVDSMAKDRLKELKESERRWKEDLDLQDNAQRTARTLDRQKREQQKVGEASEQEAREGEEKNDTALVLQAEEREQP